VTGGTRGIGRATVEALRRDGFDVVSCGRSVPAEPPPGLCVPCDVTDAAQIGALVERCRAEYGPPSVLVANAGVNATFDAVDLAEEDWDRFFAIDLKAAWLCARAVLPDMVAAGRGSIVIVSSIHAFVTREGFFPYAAAKAGLLGLTRSLALDYGPKGVRVNCLCPGFTRTRLATESMELSGDPAAAERAMVAGVALRRIAEPAEIADAIAFLASDRARYVTGTSLLVDGGLSARRAG
jgi:NAD(P)-dependent dehydrogenase (short-subunit alcohol dehydrogenase family)